MDTETHTVLVSDAVEQVCLIAVVMCSDVTYETEKRLHNFLFLIISSVG